MLNCVACQLQDVQAEHLASIWASSAADFGLISAALTLYCSCLLVDQAIQGPRPFSVAGLSRAHAGGSLPLNRELDSSSSAALNPISPAQQQHKGCELAGKHA